MSHSIQGIPASPGIAIAPVYLAHWPRVEVPHSTIAPDRVAQEIERFQLGCEKARNRTQELRALVEGRLGPVQAKIFDPQLLMLEDPELLDGTITYIRDNYVTAERAFSLRVLEFRSRWLDAPHARVVDRVADLSDVQARVLAALRDAPLPEIVAEPPQTPVILVTEELTPSRLVELDPTRVVGVATDAGTRTSHAAILARSAGIPAVVGLGDITRRVHHGQRVVLDANRGRVVLEPSDAELDWFHDRDLQVREARREMDRAAHLEPVTTDGTRIRLYANLELPEDAETAAAAGVDGVGLFRTEFLVIGKTSIPTEEEQYEAFRAVAEAFDPAPVVIRTYDLGGDKFPMFLPPLAEENPFLGWRGIRIYHRLPDLFRNQVQAILRAAAHGNVQVLLPMVNSVDEVLEARTVIDSAARTLEERGIDYEVPALGVMIETPAAVAIAEILARHVDFFSLGTNDLVQYVLAVDRSNARLAGYYDLYHPGVVRLIREAIGTADRVGMPLSVCGEAASDALAVFLMIGLSARAFSCAPSAVPEMKTLIRSIDIEHAQRVVDKALNSETGSDLREKLLAGLNEAVDITSLATIGSLSRSE